MIVECGDRWDASKGLLMTMIVVMFVECGDRWDALKGLLMILAASGDLLGRFLGCRTVREQARNIQRESLFSMKRVLEHAAGCRR